MNSLKEILNPTGFVPELMYIVSLLKLADKVRFLCPNKSSEWTVIDGPITNWKFYSGREKVARLLVDPEIGKVMIEFVNKTGKEVKDYKNVRCSPSSLQRSLALSLARESKPEKASPMDIFILRSQWFRDRNTNKAGLSEVLAKLIKSFKDPRINRQRFIFQTMQRSEGPSEKCLEQTTREVNEKFPRKKPYSVETIRSEYSRAKKLLYSKKA